MILRLFEECRDVMVVESVLDEMALPQRFDQAAIAKDTELVRYGRLGRPGRDREVAHAQRSAVQCIENLRAGPIRQGVESLDHELDDLLIWERGLAVGNRLGVDRDEILNSIYQLT